MMKCEECQQELWKAGEVVPAGAYARVDDGSYHLILLKEEGPLPATFDGHTALLFLGVPMRHPCQASTGAKDLSMSEEIFWLDPVPLFRLDVTVWALRRRASNRIDQWDGTTYTRVLALEGQAVRASVSQPTPARQPRLYVTVASPVPLAQLEERIGRVLLRTLGCDIDVSAFAPLVRHDPQVSALAERFQGLKPPRFPSLFEALLNAFACQQVSLDVGILLLNRLTEAYGKVWDDGQNVGYAFPEPEALATASTEHLRALGFSSQKARAITELAALLVQDQQAFSCFETMSNEQICQALLPLRGVGRWTAEYVLLRGLGRIDTFPGDDVGAQKNLQALLALDEKPTYERIKALTASWQPYAGFVYFHLLLEKLSQKGWLQEALGRTPS